MLDWLEIPMGIVFSVGLMCMLGSYTAEGIIELFGVKEDTRKWHVTLISIVCWNLFVGCLLVEARRQNQIKAEVLAFVNDPKTDMSDAMLFRGSNVEVRKALVARTTGEMCKTWLTDSSEEVRKVLATSSECKPYTLSEILFNDPSESVRLEALSQPLPMYLWNSMDENNNVKVRTVVSRQDFIAPETLARFAVDADRYVRMNVASNPSTPVEVLVNLSSDKDVDVRYYAAKHPQMPVVVLERMMVEDANPVVRNAALNRVRGFRGLTPSR